MDTSEIYIKMCKKAEEIQKLWSPKVGDWAWRGEKYLQIKDACIVITDINFQKTEEIWLLRQDQIQEMITEKIVTRYIKLSLIGTSMFYNLFKALDLWIDKLSSEKNHYADRLLIFSGEQLWLVFVMNEKYNKIWDGNEWMKK
jgi:hypothetical protein